MAVNLPFKVPLPRRFIILGLSASILFLFLHTFAPTALPPVFTPNLPHAEPDASYFSPSKWLPPIFNPNVPDRPPEFDEDGQCLFLSPYDALSPMEKRRAEYLELEEISAGVFRAKPLPMTGDDDPDYDDEFSEASNATRTMPAGITHPIIGLLKEGEKRWKDKLGGQSTTLDQAAQKYHDKWGRPPPKGFDLWWKFARSHKVLLPDEFDSIMRSFSPFYGLPVSTLQERLTEVEKIEETFTLVVHDGKIELQWNDDYARDVWIASRSRADKQINLMEPFIALLPSFRATFTIHDQPTILLDHARQQELLTAAKHGTVSTHPNENDRFEQDWHAACAPTDPINQEGYEELPATDSFILQHTRAMDICQHPSYLHNHGMLLEEKNAETHPKPHTKLYPIFVPSTTMLNNDIPVTPVGSDGHQDHVGSDPIWSRKSGKLYWRGLATGLNHNKREGKEWRKSHRERLHFLANDRKRLNQELLAPVGTTGEAELARYPLKELGEYYMDVKLSGGHWQCDWDDGTCQEMDDEIEFAGQDNAERSNEFKYVFDTDGNAWSSRFPRLMASNNVVIKASVFPEWNTQSLPEWYAYVPSKMDYSDLYSILAFFRGTPSGKGGHDEVARRIALNSQCWVERTWRREDMQVYMFLLYLEYARLASPDRDTGKMDFAMKGRPASAAAPVPPPVTEPEVGVGAAPIGDITPPGTFEEILDDPAPLPLAAGSVPAPVGGGAAGAMAPGAGVLPPQLEDDLLE